MIAQYLAATVLVLLFVLIAQKVSDNKERRDAERMGKK